MGKNTYFIAIFLFTVGALWLLSARPPAEPAKISTDRPFKPNYPLENIDSDIRDVTPGDALPGPKLTGRQITRLPQISKSAPKPIPLSMKTYNNALVSAAGIIQSGNSILHISDIAPLDLDAICTTKSGKHWPCGRFARTAMRGLIRGRAIKCEPVTKQPEPSSSLLVHCRSGNRNIGEWLVKQGWAKDNNGRFADQMQFAQKVKTGMWREDLP